MLADGQRPSRPESPTSRSARRLAREHRDPREPSPIRPGSTAFASRPTQKAENTSGKRGRGGGIAWLITICQAKLRATIESRLSATAAATYSHRTAWKASWDEPVRSAPPQEDADDRRDGGDRADPDPRASRDVELHAVTTCS